jgi:hypothetical protein
MVLRIEGNPHFVPPADSSKDTAEKHKAPKDGQSKPGDRLEISEKAKHLLVGGGARAEGRSPASTAKETSEIGRRIRDGFYDSGEVAGRIAARILDLLGL